MKFNEYEKVGKSLTNSAYNSLNKHVNQRLISYQVGKQRKARHKRGPQCLHSGLHGTEIQVIKYVYLDPATQDKHFFDATCTCL